MTGPTTVDPAELARFSALADKWWDGAGEFRALHLLNPHRLAFIRDQCLGHFAHLTGGPRPLVGLTALDVGCGGGLLCEPLARLGARVTGIDPAPETIGTARAHAGEQGLDITYQVLDSGALVDHGQRFDIVLAMEVVEHVADLGLFFSQIAALVAPGGLVFVATINRTAKSFALAIVAAEYVLGWVPRGTHNWDKFVRPGEIAELLEQNQMHLFGQTGITYNPLADRWNLSPDMAVNYMAVAKQS
ncbi:MAG: bifunctional 2-polyprenyl-6-hydroxyphenol methylase/3-demethylubiquinol 3-O-methyltransferase UbiG [Alphaproteobacteria bacterium]